MKHIAPFCSEKLRHMVKNLNICMKKLMTLRIKKIRTYKNSGRQKMHAQMPKEQFITGKIIKMQKFLEIG